MDPLTVSPQNAADLIPNRKDADWLEQNLKFYAGDHWQNGQGWTGPALPADHAQAQTTLAKTKKNFVFANRIREIVNRYVAGVCGRDPQWKVVPRQVLGPNEDTTMAKQALAAEATALLQRWWDGQQGITPREPGVQTSQLRQSSAYEAARTAATMMPLTRRGPLRLIIKPRFIQNGVIITQEPEMALTAIVLHAPDPRQAAVILDDALEPVSIYTYSDDDAGDSAEISFIHHEPAPGEAAPSLPIPAQEGDTIVRWTSQSDEVEDRLIALPLGRRLLMYDMEQPLLVDADIRAGQMALNKAKTLRSVNLDWAGFLERIILNGQAPGKWESDANGKEVFIPEPMVVGPATTNWIVGVEDETGSLKNPQVIFREPARTDLFDNTVDAEYSDLLSLTGQLYTLIAGDATASGKSRQQARDDFRRSLLRLKEEVDGGLRWAMETTLALVAILSGSPGRFDELRVEVDTQLDLGVIEPEEQTAARANRAAGLLSTQTAMRRIGIEDVAAEVALIQADSGQATQNQPADNAQSQSPQGES